MDAFAAALAAIASSAIEGDLQPFICLEYGRTFNRRIAILLTQESPFIWLEYGDSSGSSTLITFCN